MQKEIKRYKAKTGEVVVEYWDGAYHVYHTNESLCMWNWYNNKYQAIEYAQFLTKY